MAKISKAEERQAAVAQTVSKTEQFFKDYGKWLYGCLAVVVVAVVCVLLYNRFILQPKKAQAADQLAQAERWFEAGEYELAINGDDNSLGLDDIIANYGTKAGEAVYLYAGIAKYNTGDFEGALAALKKYNGSDPVLLGRAQACIGDTYVELEELETAVKWFEKAAKTSPNIYAAGYLLKAGIVYEELGNKEAALKAYKSVKDLYPQAPAAMEIDKYITRAEAE